MSILIIPMTQVTQATKVTSVTLIVVVTLVTMDMDNGHPCQPGHSGQLVLS